MKIGVVSDTHIPRRAKHLPGALLKGLEGVDAIIHAGDLNSDSVLYELEELAPLTAVAGNTDDAYLQALLGKSKKMEINGCFIGITHGDGEGGTTFERAKRAFAGQKVDCIVFGHSHIPVLMQEDGVLYLNPGSPTDKRRQERYSYGMLFVRDTGISGLIEYFD